MGSHYRVVPVRGFAHGSPAVIESSTPMGSPASRCGIGWRELSRRMGYPPRRDAIHRVSPARGAAPPQYLSRGVGHPVGERRDESRLYAAGILLRRVHSSHPASDAPKPDCERRVGAAGPRSWGCLLPIHWTLRPIHGMFPRFHGMFRPIHGMFPRFHGVFRSNQGHERTNRRPAFLV